MSENLCKTCKVWQERSAPEVILTKHRFRAVEDPAAPGGSLRIISCPSDTDMLGETPHNQR